MPIRRFKANPAIQRHKDHIPITERPLHTHISTNHQNWIVTNWLGIGTHRHRSRQSRANRRTVPRISGEQVCYRDRPKCLIGERFRARDTATLVPIEHHSSRCQFIYNLIPILCQSIANPMSFKCQSIQIRCQSSINPVPAKWQSIANAVPFMCQSISNPMPILDQYGPPSPIRHSYEPTKESTDRCQSLTNLPIHHKSLNNPIQILVRSPILDQHMPILD